MDALVPLLTALLMLALAVRVFATIDSPWTRHRDRGEAPRRPDGRHDAGIPYDGAAWIRLTADRDDAGSDATSTAPVPGRPGTGASR